MCLVLSRSYMIHKRKCLPGWASLVVQWFYSIDQYGLCRGRGLALWSSLQRCNQLTIYQQLLGIPSLISLQVLCKTQTSGVNTDEIRQHLQQTPIFYEMNRIQCLAGSSFLPKFIVISKISQDMYKSSKM